MHLCEEKKSLKKKMGLNGWCLFGLSLNCISPPFCLLKINNQYIVHDMFSSHNDVHLWNVYQIEKEKKKKEMEKNL